MSLMDINRTMNKKADAFSLLPEQQLQGMNMRGMQSLQKGVSPDLVELLAVQDAIKRKNDSKNALMLAQEEDPNTIKSQKANELVEQSRRELGLPSQQEKAMAVAQVLANRQKTANKNLQQVMSKGLGGMKRPNMSVPMAQGGVVGYQEGGGVKDFLFGDEYSVLGMSPAELASLGLILVPGGGLVRAGLGALKLGAPAAKGLAGMAQRGIRSLYSKPKFDPKMQGPLPAGAKFTDRVFSPARTARSLGVAGLLGSQMLKDEEPKPKKEEPKKEDKKLDLDKDTTPQTTTVPTVDKGATEKEKNDAFQRLVNIATAPGGFKNMARTDLRRSQLLLLNDQKDRQLDIQEQTAKAQTTIAKVTKDSAAYNKLLTQAEKLQKQLKEITDEVMNTPLGQKYSILEMEAAEDESLQEELEAHRQLIRAAIEERAQSFKSEDNIGLIAQLKAIQNRLYSESTGIDRTKAPKVV
tara:strand:+ start:1303 stop:2703 length:1401 start_codon:yes stop_codon:yes gene_type:complete